MGQIQPQIIGNMMYSSESMKIAWDEEYKRKGIPSSFRKDATKPVIEFMGWLKQREGFTQGLAADIGCGRGRNSFYLASQGFQVIGIELLEENVDAINTEAKLSHLPVQAFALDAANKWPMAPNSLDIVIDVFCYKHIVDKEKQAKYRCELWQSLKASGFYFISLASEHDGFYGPLLEKSTNLNEKLVIDPYSNIASFLYSEESLIKEFSDFFEMLEVKEQISTSPMYEKEYSRRVINAIFKKRI